MERCKLKRKFISIILGLVISVSIGQGTYAAETVQSPKLAAETAVAIDANSGEIIYEKNLDNKVYPASTTKLLTALLLADSKKQQIVLLILAVLKHNLLLL